MAAAVSAILARFETVEARLDRLEKEGRSLIADLPKIASNAIREVLA